VGLARPPLREIVTAAGERELDRFSPRANLLEALGLYGLILASLWGLVGHLGIARGSAAARGLGFALLGACLLHVALLSPWLHGDGWESRGLPRPGALRAALRSADPRERQRLAAGLAGFAAGLGLLLLRGWPNLLTRLGVRRHLRPLFEALTGGVAALAAPLVACALLLPAAALLLRLDNLGAALRGLAPVALALWGGVLALALLHAERSGDFGRFAPEGWLAAHPDRTSGFFYLAWALVQQYAFLGYFNTRLRRGIGPRGRGPLSGRVLAALATGALFGAIHLPTLHLAAATAAAGALLGWTFQVDRQRNLLLTAAVHAVAGTLYSRLLPFSMHAGPWD
jgi:hypothetical protein